MREKEREIYHYRNKYRLLKNFSSFQITNRALYKERKIINIVVKGAHYLEMKDMGENKRIEKKNSVAKSALQL